MIVTRIAQNQYIRLLDGMGSFLYGGRWSSKGTFAIYTAEFTSLAYLEYLVHQFERNTWPKNLAISKLEISDSMITTISKEQLPANWQSILYLSETQFIGDRYFKEGELAIKVPSVIVDGEFNVVLNPEHNEFSSAVKRLEVNLLALDKRFKSS